MNARIALGKVLGMVVAAGITCSLTAAEATAAGWYGTPVVVSHGVMTAAVPYTTYGSYGGGGPATVWPASTYPAGYSSYYGNCPGGNCSVMPAYNTSAVYYGASSAACPNGQCYINSACPNGQCYPSTIGNSIYPATYYSAPALRGGVSSPVYYRVPAGTTMPAVTQPQYYAPVKTAPATLPIGGTGSGSGGNGAGLDSPFYP